MKFILSTIFFVITYSLFAQSISGLLIDNENSNPLQYASIGIMNTPYSTISDEKGAFSLNYNTKDIDSIVRFSMLGYKDFTISIREFESKSDNIFKLEPKIFQLPEVVMNIRSNEVKVGITDRSTMSGFCGWEGNRRGKGHEIGLKIELGDSIVELKKIHIRVHKQSFYSSLFRLHIRKIENEIPTSDLLNENIFIPLEQSTGWVEFNLSSYNLVFKGSVVVTLEWIDVSEIDKNKLTKVNNSKEKTANVLLSIKKNEGNLYFRRGSEAKWIILNDQGPSIYLTVSN